MLSLCFKFGGSCSDFEESWESTTHFYVCHDSAMNESLVSDAKTKLGTVKFTFDLLSSFRNLGEDYSTSFSLSLLSTEARSALSNK